MRTKLLRSGLGFFAFAAGISLVNVLFFPYARENYGYGLIGLWLAYAAALALLMLAVLLIKNGAQMEIVLALLYIAM